MSEFNKEGLDLSSTDQENIVALRGLDLYSESMMRLRKSLGVYAELGLSVYSEDNDKLGKTAPHLIDDIFSIIKKIKDCEDGLKSVLD